MILVTGGTGLLGAHLLVQLTQKSVPIRAIYRQKNQLFQTKKIFSYYDSESFFEQIEWVESDMTNYHDLEKAMQGIEYVYHCAAVVSFNDKEQDSMLHVNVEGTKNIVTLALKYGVKKLCHVSSTSAIGKTFDGSEINENCVWNKTTSSFYGKTKHLSEQLVWEAASKGLQMIIVNPAIIIGPGDWKKSSTNLFSEVYKGLPFVTGGSNGFVDVRDVALGMIQLMESNIHHERFLMVSENLLFSDFFHLIAKHLNVKSASWKVPVFITELAWRFNLFFSWISSKPPRITKETASSSQAKNRYSNQKIKSSLNFTFIPVEEAIKHTARIFLKEVGSVK
jgi:dihydroflavonol-4-reductase